VLFLHMNLKYPPLFMGGLTAIELGVHSCLLVRVYPGQESIRLAAIGGTGTDEWEEAGPLSDNLQRARRSGSFPRHATIVDWNLRGEASDSDPFAEAGLAPIRDAGFVIDAVLSPPDALCLLAGRRPRAAGREGEVWLALNRDAVSIAIVDNGRLLYSRTFDWHYRTPATPREELLQRYTLVAHLAPEVSHGIQVARAEHGTFVNAVITCGDLPDLRSLTMPLIEELDIEVETLDTLDGLRVDGNALRDIVAERAPALRLACAAAGRSGTRPAAIPSRAVAAAAGLIVLVLLAGWALMWGQPSAPASAPLADSRPTAVPAARPAESSKPLSPPPAPASASTRVADDTVPTTGHSPGPGPAAPQPADTTATATSGRTAGQPGYEVPRAVNRDDALPPARTAALSVSPAAAQRLKPLSAPLPEVNSILVASDRRLAVLNGEIVREGQPIGPRVLIRIEPGAVVLREPSGYEVRVPIRRKLS
jgi:hypothetical protein